MATTETRKMVLAAVAVCDEKKAENTRVLELDPSDSGFTDFFLITSGTNTRQTVAIADDIELKMKREFGTYANSVEGRRTGEWILMDYVDFVVHIFVEEKRAFYDIERLRKSARSIDTTQLKAALTEKTAAARRTHPRPAVNVKAAAEVPSTTKAVSGKKTAAKRVVAKKSAVKTAAKTSAKKRPAPAKKSATRIAAAAEAVATPSLPAKKSTLKKAPAARKSTKKG
jgi:ribosome-associated protein